MLFDQLCIYFFVFFFFQAEDGIRDHCVTGVQTCALPIYSAIAVVTAQIAESVSGMAVVQAFNRERSFQQQFDELNVANREQNIYTQTIFSIFFPSIEFLGVIATGAVLYTGNALHTHHTITIGTLITALYLLQLVFQPLQELSDVYGQLQSGAAAMVKIATVLDEEPEIRDARDARELPRIEGDLDIDHVVFAYGAEPVLHGVAIHVPEGGCLALVGGSGGSAGERQLISIARALLADPRILILDEATSNIDRPTEVLIERALDRLLHGRTSIIIAHRLSTVRRADEIVVIEHGRIVQRGTESELLAEEGPFRRLAHDLSGGAAVRAAAS